MFVLPSSSSITRMGSYLYFTVNKNTSDPVITLHAYGDYAHSTQAVTGPQVSYAVNLSGIVLGSGCINKFDSIASANSYQVVNWY